MQQMKKQTDKLLRSESKRTIVETRVGDIVKPLNFSNGYKVGETICCGTSCNAGGCHGTTCQIVNCHDCCCYDTCTGGSTHRSRHETITRTISGEDEYVESLRRKLRALEESA